MCPNSSLRLSTRSPDALSALRAAHSAGTKLKYPSTLWVAGIIKHLSVFALQSSWAVIKKRIKYDTNCNFIRSFVSMILVENKHIKVFNNRTYWIQRLVKYSIWFIFIIEQISKHSIRFNFIIVAQIEEISNLLAAACDATLFSAAHYFCRKHTHTNARVWRGLGGTLERIVMCIGKFSNEFPKCDKDICIEFPIPQHANMCTHTERGGRCVCLCVCMCVG